MAASLEAGSQALSTGAGAATTQAFTIPSGTVAGDTILLYCSNGASITTTWSSGSGATAFAAQSQVNGSGGIAGQLLTHAYTGTEGWTPGTTTITVTASASHPWTGVICAVTGTAGPDPALSGSGQANTGSTTITVGGVTTTQNNDLLIWFAGVGTGGGGTPGTITPPAGFTGAVTQVSTSSGSLQNSGLLMATGAAVTAGPTGNQNGTNGSSQVSTGVLVSFSPAGSGGVIGIRASQGFANATTSTTIAVPAQPGVQLGDLILIWVDSVAATLTFSDAGDGFTAVTAATGSNGSSQLLYRTATSADVTLSGSAGSYTVTCSVSHAMSGVTVVIIGPTVTPDPPFSNSGQILGGTGTSLPATGVTTTVTNDLLLWFGFSRVGSGAPVAISSVPAGFTTAVSQTNSTSGSANVGSLLATAVQAAAGPTGTQTGAFSSSTNGGALLIAFASFFAAQPVIVSPAVNRAANW